MVLRAASEDGRALVAGGAITENNAMAEQQNARHVRVERPFILGGKPTRKGEVLELARALAAELVSSHKAAYCEAEAPRSAPSKAKE